MCDIRSMENAVASFLRMRQIPISNYSFTATIACLLAHTQTQTLTINHDNWSFIVLWTTSTRVRGMSISFDSFVIHRRLWKQCRRLMRTQSTKSNNFVHDKNLWVIFVWDKRHSESPSVVRHSGPHSIAIAFSLFFQFCGSISEWKINHQFNSHE